MIDSADLAVPSDPDPGRAPRYAVALLDWMACALAGWGTPAAIAARASDDLVAGLGAAGHVLDFDDTYGPGLAHITACVAPAALVVGADVCGDVADVLRAFARGWEAVAALTAANHPALYNRGWHPTAVAGTVGSAIAAIHLLNAQADAERHAIRLALLRAAGLLGAFGSDGKALQVGLAAAAGVQAARAAAAGAHISGRAVRGFEAAYGARLVLRGERPDAIDHNWIKAYPCCLQTHGAIDAALAARQAGHDVAGSTVAVHPVSLQAAAVIEPRTGLEAKFSIPYTTALAFLHGTPRVAHFDTPEDEVLALASRVTVRADPGLAQSEARLATAGGDVHRVLAAHGSPANPLEPERLRDKVTALAGTMLDGALDDPHDDAAGLLGRLRRSEDDRPAATAS